MENEKNETKVRLNIEIFLKDRYKLKEIAAKRNIPLRVLVMRAIVAYIQQEERYEAKETNNS